MQLSKTNKVFILFLFFVAVGLFMVLSTHQTGQFLTKDSQLPPLVSATDYADHVRPWLVRVINNPSLENISQTKQDLLNLKSSDKNIGQTHIKLFLAMDAWENYLTTKQSQMKTVAQDDLTSVSNDLPELSTEIDNLKNILSNV